MGRAKRKHGGAVYVPERERELLARVRRLARGKVPSQAVTAIFREILSSSRFSQEQAPIGMLTAEASQIEPYARWCFGACDQFAARKTWREIAAALKQGVLTVAVLTGVSLAKILTSASFRHLFLAQFIVVGDFSLGQMGEESLEKTAFIVAPQGIVPAPQARQALILIECKSTVNAVKSLLHAMPDFFMEPATPGIRLAAGRPSLYLTRLFLRQSTPGEGLAGRISSVLPPSLQVSLVGVYPGGERHVG